MTGELASILDAGIRLAVPLVLAAFAGLYSERAGVIDIGLEGKMLGAAFAAAAAASITGSAWLGLAAGLGTGLVLAVMHGYAAVTWGGNQVISGMAINILVAGLVPTLAGAWFGQGGDTPALGPTARFMPVTLASAEALVGVPVVGSVLAPVLGHVLDGRNPIVYATAFLVPVLAWVLRATRFGLRLRAVGENPQAVDMAGISVAWLRYRALLVAGALCGLAGAYLSIAQGAGFVRDMTAGRGYLALAALILGRWRPLPTLLACLLFALADAGQLRLQGASLPWIGVVPPQLVQAIPYVATVLLLAGMGGRVLPPRALGTPYVKSR
jgi:simple sugar transport system permease protein